MRCKPQAWNIKKQCRNEEIMQFSNKRFLVVGTGKSGVAAVSLLSKEVTAITENGAGIIVVEGNNKLSREEVARYVESLELLALKIEPLEEAKHIFSHIEWQMTGYMVRVAQLDEPVLQKEGYVFAESHVSEEKYAIPSAFARYTKYMDIHLGIHKNQK